MTEAVPSSIHLASLFKAAGDQMRLNILRIMQRDSYGVLELCRIFSVQQPSMSHHLKVLAKAGAVATRREGNSIFYRRASSTVRGDQKILEDFFALVDSAPIASALLEQVNNIQIARRARSTEFFRENAARFREQQDLIAGHKDYGSRVAAMLAKSMQSHWLEVGPGDGELLNDCAANFSQVTAIDVSLEMLEQSRGNLSTDLKANVAFENLDTKAAVDMQISADVISCNMVLHHVPSPGEMVEDMAALLSEGGQLVITDLDEHDQDWARESCGDLWLGFAPEQINDWANSAGLRQGRSEFLALRNGFGVQIREYLK